MWCYPIYVQTTAEGEHKHIRKGIRFPIRIGPGICYKVQICNKKDAYGNKSFFFNEMNFSILFQMIKIYDNSVHKLRSILNKILGLYCTYYMAWLFYNLVDSAPTLAPMVLYSFLLRVTDTRQKTILRLYSNQKRKSHRMALGRVRIFWMRSVFRFSSINSSWLVLRMR